MSTLLAAIRAREAPVSNVRVTVRGHVEPSPDRFTALLVVVDADHDDPDLMRKLITIAENGCLVTNTLRQGLEVRSVLADR